MPGLKQGKTVGFAKQTHLYSIYSVALVQSRIMHLWSGLNTFKANWNVNETKRPENTRVFIELSALFHFYPLNIAWNPFSYVKMETIYQRDYWEHIWQPCFCRRGRGAPRRPVLLIRGQKGRLPLTLGRARAKLSLFKIIFLHMITIGNASPTIIIIIIICRRREYETCSL